MLYVTTRNNRDACTANRALEDHRGAKGGYIVPFREPKFSREEIHAFSEMRFGQCVAEVLNRLTGSKLTGWDVDLTVGRYPVRLQTVGHRMILGECWHNLEQTLSRTVKLLARKINPESDMTPGSWADIAVRVAILFGIYGQLMGQGIAGEDAPVDIAVTTGDFSGPISAWYARRWGLPIGNIICACNENGNLWDLICHGQMKTGDIAVSTNTPDGDVVVPAGLERLIYGCGGTEEVERYLDALRKGSVYYASEPVLREMRRGLHVTVTSRHRVVDAISSIYSSYGYVLSPYSALIYAGVQDYRARTGENRTAVVLAEKCPLLDSPAVSAALGISREQLKKLF